MIKLLTIRIIAAALNFCIFFVSLFFAIGLHNLPLGLCALASFALFIFCKIGAMRQSKELDEKYKLLIELVIKLTERAYYLKLLTKEAEESNRDENLN